MYDVEFDLLYEKNLSPELYIAKELDYERFYKGLDRIVTEYLNKKYPDLEVSIKNNYNFGQVLRVYKLSENKRLVVVELSAIFRYGKTVVKEAIENIRIIPLELENKLAVYIKKNIVKSRKSEKWLIEILSQYDKFGKSLITNEKKLCLIINSFLINITDLVVGFPTLATPFNTYFDITSFDFENDKLKENFLSLKENPEELKNG